MLEIVGNVGLVTRFGEADKIRDDATRTSDGEYLQVW
jgi:hypothetical protein